MLIRIVQSLVDRLSDVSISDRTKTALQVTISGALLVYLATVIPIGSLDKAVSAVSLPFLVIIIAVIFAKKATSVMAIHQLLQSQIEVSPVSVFMADSMIAIGNSIIPTQAGGLVAAPIVYERYLGLPKIDGFVLKSVDFLITATTTGVITVIGVIILFSELNTAFALLFFGAATIYLGFTSAVVIAAHFGSFLPRSIRPLVPERVKRLAEEDVPHIPRKRIVNAVIFQTTSVLLLSIRFIIIAAGLGVFFPLHVALFAPIMIYSLTVYPVSFNGLGVVEAAAIFVLSALGVPTETASAIIILDRALGTYIPMILSGTVAGVAWQFSLLEHDADAPS